MSLQTFVESTTLEAVAIAIASGYAIRASTSSIPKLRKYEARAQKAAEWSTAAEKRLWNTRYTVGAGLIAASVSLLSAVYYTAFVTRHTGPLLLGWPVLMAAGGSYVTRFMRSFWDAKLKIPLLDEYNEAISDTATVIRVLDWLVAGWSLIAFVKLMTTIFTDSVSLH